MAAKILAFAGSIRKESANQKFIKIAAEKLREEGGEVTLINLADFPLPIYNGDLEQNEGLPENARKLKELFKSHQALVIAAPEYNSSITPLLKNVIDWVSRKEGSEGELVAYRGKVAGLLSASPGALGGLRGLVTVRSILGNIGVLVIPTQVSVSNAYEAFDSAGALKDPSALKRLGGFAKELVSVSSRMGG